MPLVTIRQASELLNITVQGVRNAIAIGRIPARMFKGKRMMQFADILHYKATRWAKFTHFEDGEMPPKIAAEIIGCPLQHVYFLIRQGILPSYCKAKKTITVKDVDVRKAKERYLKKKIAKL